ncbi:MAG: AAA family ATPase [Muribaculaceae bacterium]|nr:AAA family ATPase [Muribaculaceae bacterium]
MSILKQGEQVNDYTVEYLIKANAYCETYRVADDDGSPFFLKLFIIKNIPEKLLTRDGAVREIEHCKRLMHENIISYITSGTLMIPEGVCHYMVTVYFSGELLVEKLEREGSLTASESTRIVTGILHALQYMHDKHGLMHNDITPRNIMLSAKTDGIPELIDMGHVSGATSGVTPFDTSDLEVQYSANSTFAGMYDESTDVYSAVAVLYAMLTGRSPWAIDGSLTRREAIREVKKLRKQPLDLEGAPAEMVGIVSRGLSSDPEERYKTVRELLRALDDPSSVEPAAPKSDSRSASSREHGGNDDDAQARETSIDIEVKKGKGNGFKDIAGMEDMKEMLSKRVIFILRDKELAQRYRLTPPNGMLLYGPPGCGKSFFAEKFAEETGFNFMLVKASDLGSVYIHGTQGKIAELFKKAEKNAPTVLCFDEFDAFVPDRSNDLGNHHSGEVNEFLSQLNNCSQRGIFVIATSNRPDKIDPAVLRTGRIDKMVYVPLPDQVARREMLKLHLKDRPCDELDYEKLATLSEGYVASDITYVVNEAAMIAAYNNANITEELMETTIGGIKPSVKGDALKEYDRIRDKMEGNERRNSLPKVGFTSSL